MLQAPFSLNLHYWPRYFEAVIVPANQQSERYFWNLDGRAILVFYITMRQFLRRLLRGHVLPLLYQLVHFFASPPLQTCLCITACPRAHLS